MISNLTKGFEKAGIDLQSAFTDTKTLDFLDATAQAVDKSKQALIQAISEQKRVQADATSTDEQRATSLQAVVDAEKEVAFNTKAASLAQKEASAEMASNMALIGGVVAATTITFGILVKIVKESTDAFVENIAKLRELQIITGLTSVQTAALAKQARDLGLSQDVVVRGVFAFTRQLESLENAQEQGQKVNNNFSRELENLGISTLDAAGNFRPFNEVLLETFEKIRGLPTEIDKTAAASQLFGRQNAGLVILLADSIRSMDDEVRVLRELGLVAGPDATAAMRNLQLAQSDLNDAATKTKTTLGEAFAPALTKIYNQLVPLVQLFVEYIARIRATGVFTQAFIMALTAGVPVTRAFDIALKAHNDTLEELTKGITDAQDAEQKQAIAEANAADALQQATDRRERAMQQEQDALKQLQDARDKALKNYMRGLDELAIREERDAIERGMREQWETEDTTRRNLQRQQDLWKDYQRKLEDIERGANQKIQDQRKEQQRKLEDLERQHQIRLLQIQFAYQDAVEEALRSNDTVAILRAMRDRRRALRDEELKQSEQRDQLQRDYEQRRQDQQEELARQREDAKRDYEQRLADLQESIRLESEEKARQNERDRIMRELQHRWALEDLRRQYDQQLADAQEAYEKQRTEYAQFLTDMGTTAAQGIITISNQIAQAVETGSQTVLTAEEQWLKRHFYLMSEAVTSSIGLSREEQWQQRHQFFSRAEGGVDVVNSPTTFLAGEAGPEIAAFLPLRHTMSVNHSFGNLPLSLNGSPLGGMGKSETEQLVYAILYQLPDILRGRR